MTAMPPNTAIYLPPEHRRAWWEIGLLFVVGVIVPLVILWLLIRAVAPVESSPPAATSLMTETTPVIVELTNNYIVPTVTPSPTTPPIPTPTPLAVVYCGPTTKSGAVCQWPDPPPPTSTPYPDCPQVGEPTPAPGTRCRWREEVLTTERMWE
jgi:hypothetical protein